MRRNKTVLVLVYLLVAVLLVACGSSDVEQVAKVEENQSSNGEASGSSEEKPNEDKEQITVFNLGETAIIDNKYSVTILGVTETDERNEYSDKEVSQVLIIDYMYENIASEDDDVYISEYNFKFIDEQGNMCDSYPVGGEYGPQYTPVGAKTYSTMTIGTVEQSSKIKLVYYDNIFDSKSLFEYNLVIGESIEPDFSGELPKYDKVFSLGDEVEVTTSEGVYTITINSVKKLADRNQYSDKNPGAVYLIDYTYENISQDDDLYISEFNFSIIDNSGNLGFSYPASTSKYPQNTIKGAKTTAEMSFGTHVDGDTIILRFSDNMFSDKADIFFLIPDIKQDIAIRNCRNQQILSQL